MSGHWYHSEDAYLYPEDEWSHFEQEQDVNGLPWKTWTMDA